MANNSISKSRTKAIKEIKYGKSIEKHHKICVYQKNAVPLHPLLKRKRKRHLGAIV